MKIYALCDPLSQNVRYVGKTVKKLEHRLSGHLTPNRLATNTHKNNWIRSLLDKGVKPEIFLLEEVPDAEWVFWEKWWIAYLSSLGVSLTNETEGGDGWELGQKHKAESLEKMSKSQTGRKHSPETRAKISASNMGKIMSESARVKMSLAKKNVPKSEEFKQAVSKKLKGRVFSEEHRKKLSLANMRRIRKIGKRKTGAI